MSVSLDTAVIQSFLQVLPAVDGLVTKVEEHCQANGLDPRTLTEARLAQDMWSFAKQVFECGHHSSRAIEAVRKGVFNPELHEVSHEIPALRMEIADAIAVLEAVEPGELDAMADRDMRFEYKTMVMPFTVADFLLSFAMPNFYFHATTAYDILRNQGLQIGKMDYMGRPRMKA